MFRIIYPNRWFIWAIVACLVVGVLVWWQIVLYSLDQELANILVPEPHRKVALTGVDTTGWKTYRNEKYGFEFKYMENFQILPQEEYENKYQLHTEKGVTRFEIYNPADEGNYENSMDMRSRNKSINVKISPEPQKALGIMRGIIAENIKDNPYSPRPLSEKTVNINGKDIYFYEEPSIVGPYPIFYLTTSLFYLEIYGWDEDFLRGILSTFKFIEPIDTSTWKTYRSEKYGFEIKFPDQLSINSQTDDYFQLTQNGKEFLELIILGYTSIEKQEQGHFASEVISVGGVESNMFLIPEGLCDGPDLCSPPAVVIDTYKANIKYQFIFYKKDLNNLDRHILSTFKFIQPSQ